MRRAKVIILRTGGTNCDVETAFAFKRAGASCELVHINRLLSSDKKLDNYQILAIPGGFTYGDDIASGKILANEIKYKLKKDMIEFVKNGKLIIGICNGFQVLVKSGFLPNTTEDFDKIEASLSINDSGKFEDRWVYLRSDQKPETGKQKCVWTRGIKEIIYLPVAHAEGKFLPLNKRVLGKLKHNHQIVFKYSDEKGRRGGYPQNPNGSLEDIASVCDPSGRVFGIMPHPERHIRFTQHPRWTRMKKDIGDCTQIFLNGVKAASKL